MNDNLNDLITENLEKKKPLELEIEKTKFSQFLKIISSLSKECVDVVIKDNKISQRNNSKSAFFCVSLDSIFDKPVDLLMSRIDKKVELLSSFKNQKVDVKFITDYDDKKEIKSYTFKDDYSKLVFINPLEEHLNNKYIKESELKNKLLNIDESGSIFEHEISKFLIERIYSISKGLDVNSIDLEFKNGKAEFKMSSSENKSNVATGTIITIDNLNRDLTGLCSFRIQPFLMLTECKVACYLRQNQEVLFLKLESEIENIPIVIWLISSIEKG